MSDVANLPRQEPALVRALVPDLLRLASVISMGTDITQRRLADGGRD